MSMPRKRLRPSPSPSEEEQEVVVKVSALREPMRQARTDARVPEREAIHGRERKRRRSSMINEDTFYIPQDEIPEDSSYEWKRYAVNGLEDPFYIANMREQGWEPVNPKRHPTWVPPGYNQPHIIKGGQILMERPIELTREAQAEQRQLAKKQMREAEQRLGMTPQGELTRQHPNISNRVVKEVMRPVIVAEE